MKRLRRQTETATVHWTALRRQWLLAGLDRMIENLKAADFGNKHW